MLTKNKLTLLIALVICLEMLIYCWAFLTSTWDKANFFAIEPQFTFDKCARNSGRVSSALNLIILSMIAYDGLRQIYRDVVKKDRIRVLITLFAVNHLLHFFFVFQTFKHHAMALSITENTHGFITFISILALPVILWSVKNLNSLLYTAIIVHLFNVSYFIMETFYNKITPEKPAYHNQFGIAVTSIACLCILYRIFLDYRSGRVFRDLTIN